MKNNLKVAVAALAGIVLGLASVPVRAQTAAQNEIVLATSLPLTGKYAADGVATRNGYRLAADRVNAKGGVKVGAKTFKLKLVYVDNQSLAERVTEDTENFITKDGVKFMLGSYSSALIGAQSKVTDKHKILLVQGSGADRSLYMQGSKHFFGVLNTADAYFSSAIDLLAEYAKKAGQDTKTLKVAIAVEPDSFSRDVRNGTLRDIEKYGMQIVVNEELPKELDDMLPILEKVRAAKPDIFFVSGHSKGAALLARQLPPMKLGIPMLVLTHCDGAKLAETFGKGVQGYTCSSQWDGSLPLRDRWFENAAGFASSYLADFKQAAPYQAAQAGAAVLVFANAFEKAGTLDPEKVRQAVAATNLKTFFGAVRFDENGRNTAKTMVVYQIQDGDYKVVAPSQWAQSALIYPIQ